MGGGLELAAGRRVAARRDCPGADAQRRGSVRLLLGAQHHRPQTGGGIIAVAEGAVAGGRRGIQRLLLPQTSPTLPGFDIAGRCYPAEFAAGDHFDYFCLPDGWVVVAIADVSGHADIRAEIVTASFHARFRTLAGMTSDMPQIMQTLNAQAVCRNIPANSSSRGKWPPRSTSDRGR